MDTADSTERNLHQAVATEASNHLGTPVEPGAVQPVQDQPAVMHEQAQVSSAETPFEDWKEDILGKKDRFIDNNTPRGPLSVLKGRVDALTKKVASSVRGSDEDSIA